VEEKANLAEFALAFFQQNFMRGPKKNPAEQDI
jgi:hypothetical protein